VSAHAIQWVSPSPLWSKTLGGGLDDVTMGQQMRTPILLRFQQDKFMDELAQILAQDPSGLDANLALPVTYRLPAPGEDQPPEPTELKLFQAAHGHFYLVAASLSCRLPGLPDHEVETTAKEQVAFVLRRIDADGEWGWVADPETAGAKKWSLLTTPTCVTPSEDLLPLFPVRYQNGERPRRIYVGLVPTSSSDTFKAAGKLSPLVGSDSPLAGAPPKDPRPSALTIKVTDPLRALAAAKITAPADAANPGAVVAAEIEQIKQASRFLLVDFAEFLTVNIPAVWTALANRKRPADPAAAALYDALVVGRADSHVATSWRDALDSAWKSAAILYGDASGNLPPELNLANSTLSGDQLDVLVVRALPTLAADGGTDTVTSIQGDSVSAPQVPKLDPQGQWTYQIRCAYLRPECGPLQCPVVSDPTRSFQLAGFFDLDAPSRQIYVSLPVNTGIGDLRKLRKNVNFLISNQLRAQMNRVANLNDALKGQFADGGSFDLGLICSFSIPIITICALLVLMIFVQLLNIVFWWLPFLRICFPIGLKADSS
jgi:hypothetical protein